MPSAFRTLKDVPKSGSLSWKFVGISVQLQVHTFAPSMFGHIHLFAGEEMDPSSSFHDPPQTMQPIRLPEPTLANLGDIERQIRAVHRLGQIRERVAENVVS